MIRNFQDLKAYQDSKNLYAKIAVMTRKFPAEGKYLASQICRAANSIHANIAEGFGRSEAEFKKFLTTALGSNNEVLSHLEDAVLAGYLSLREKSLFKDGYTVVGKTIFRLREKWKRF